MAGNNVSQRSYNSRIIAICFISELAKRRAWRERRHRLLAFHVFTLHQLLAASAPAQEQDPDGPELRASHLRQAQATITEVHQALFTYEQTRPFRVECVADSLAPDLFDIFRRGGMAWLGR